MQKMADTQDMTQLITQAVIESTKATVQEMSVQRAEQPLTQELSQLVWDSRYPVGPVTEP